MSSDIKVKTIEYLYVDPDCISSKLYRMLSKINTMLSKYMEPWMDHVAPWLMNFDVVRPFDYQTGTIADEF